jgi:hypothetical protein
MTVRALPCLIAVLALAGALAATPAGAASSGADGSTTNTAKKQKSRPAKFVKNPYLESTSERERRLMRECKGLPNAGACLGYAS